MIRKICRCGERFDEAQHTGRPREWCDRCKRNCGRRDRVRAGLPVPHGPFRYCGCGRRIVRSRTGEEHDRCSRCRDVRRKEKGVFVPLPPIDWSKVRNVTFAEGVSL